MKFISLLSFCLFFSTIIAAQEQFSVYFDSNKFELIPKERNSLNQWIVSNPNVKIVGIYGFCDEVGSTGSNDTLAKNRINYVYNAIKDKVKIRADFKSRSFGELHNVSKIKAENRKVSLFYLQAKDLNRENEILGIKQETRLKPKKTIKYPEKLVFDNPNGTKTEFKLDTLFMKKVSESKIGEKFKLENLIFQINTFAVIPTSKGKMYELLLVLKNNPQLKIQIQGHLCCMPNDRLDLSTQRAKAINNFLLANGIEDDRLTFKGFGSTQPIFPLPEKDETERAANRRVEIMIVEN